MAILTAYPQGNGLLGGGGIGLGHYFYEVAQDQGVDVSLDEAERIGEELAIDVVEMVEQAVRRYRDATTSTHHATPVSERSQGQQDR